MNINNPLIRKLAATLMGILLLTYVGYQIYIINYKGLSTETATYAELSDTIQTSGWIIRNESVVDYPSTGVLSYNLTDGQKVSKDKSIADVYATENDAATVTKISKIDKEISSLESLRDANEYYSNNPELIGTQIDNALVSILTQAADRDYNDSSSDRSHLQYLLNQKKIIVGSENTGDYQQRIQDLRAERDSLAASAGGRIDYVSAPESGYFISEVDGYEDSFDYDNVAALSVSDLKNVKKGTAPATSCGKICKDFSWYIGMVIDEGQKIKLEKSSYVYLEIPFATAEQIPAEVVSINFDSESGQYAAVLKCNSMSSDIAAIRNETIQVIVNTYSGVLVNQKSIRFESVTRTETDKNGTKNEVTTDNVKGVYVKYGTRLSFVQIFSDITINGYAICKTELSDEEQGLLVTENTIALYDEVVTEGTNLYDGKLL